MTTTERPERSVPKPVFTDAEAGAREFPDSGANARRFNYFKPAKRTTKTSPSRCSLTRGTT
jgi:propane 2-monooxygenase small subunit